VGQDGVVVPPPQLGHGEDAEGRRQVEQVVERQAQQQVAEVAPHLAAGEDQHGDQIA